MKKNTQYFTFIPNDRAPLADDAYLTGYLPVIGRWQEKIDSTEKRLTGGKSPLIEFARAHEYYGLHFDEKKAVWIFREWAPNAEAITLIGDFSAWEINPQYDLQRIPGSNGDWEIILPGATLGHQMHYALYISNAGRRLPAYARYVVQDEVTKIFSAMVWRPPDGGYVFQNPTPAPRAVSAEFPDRPASALIYEAHVGMAQEDGKVGSFREFETNIIPKIARSGYDTLQLMAIMSHPYYGSFGYHVANFFSISGIFGTPDEFKSLVDAAHKNGLRVVIDLVHSHAVKNEVEGLANFDGSRSTYFHSGARGEHKMWDSLCFNYGKDEVLRFLLSNCRFWLEEYHVDGFRFDGVTSMLYFHHGLSKAFTSYDDYFQGEVDEEALTYLALANKVVHAVRPDAVTIAEDISGLPGLASPELVGFDFRLAMGVSDMWFKLFDIPDEKWDMHYLFGELTNRRRDERSIAYVESHDQSLVGGQTAFFRMAGDQMYTNMTKRSPSLTIDRACALHKISRALTMAAGSDGYLNFFGNEFGHPEWVDFPREGNNWSFHYARRQWSLAENELLRYGELAEFDREILKIVAGDFYRHKLQKIVVDNAKKIIVFERAGFIFCANLHISESFFGYSFEAPGGEWKLLLSSDEARFGGFGALESGGVYPSGKSGSGVNAKKILQVYLPSRTVSIFGKI